MSKRSPYSISFGRIPNQYISRSLLIDDIIDILNSNPVEEQAFKLTGIRGTGKTVTLTAIEKELKEDSQWIIVDINSNSDISKELVANLYGTVPFLSSFIDANLNLSAFGIGINLEKKSPVTSMDVILKKILEEVQKKNKKVLVVIDEARKTDALVDFIQEFQILIRNELPIYLIAAGLYEDIEGLENADGLTFFLRATKYEMKPLNLVVIEDDYEKTLGVSEEVAKELATYTKGYAFAYQAFGKYMWESGDKEISKTVLALVDEALAAKVYDKIWSELREKEKWYLTFIVEKDSMSASELLEITKTSHNEWSEPRKRLIEKGILDGSERGIIKVRLPRFKEYVEVNKLNNL
ncbi:ATPase [Pseudobutyrivibrio sp. ACV-2]|uniref:P-loop NTPase fold protein n=1 Tax=Pseudobutyrivibrio sp. ACV-2 TaxID=1520801 RepID=UPI000894729B|nr:P-loop NTPase fold protein [Pseudobutyrivibrio sp. ACV-2]SEA57613.1 ATPase [Pseudobutyrivibrio sp. ACV-2]